LHSDIQIIKFEQILAFKWVKKYQQLFWTNAVRRKYLTTYR